MDLDFFHDQQSAVLGFWSYGAVLFVAISFYKEFLLAFSKVIPDWLQRSHAFGSWFVAALVIGSAFLAFVFVVTEEGRLFASSFWCLFIATTMLMLAAVITGALIIWERASELRRRRVGVKEFEELLEKDYPVQERER